MRTVYVLNGEMPGGREMKTTYGVIWHILNELDVALDVDGYKPAKELTAEKFGITENRFGHYLLMLQKAGYVDGVRTAKDITGKLNLDYSEIEITLDGIQFLLENSVMRKIAAAAERMGLIVAEAGVGAAGAAVAARLGK